MYSTLISAGNPFAEMNGGVDGIINTHLSGGKCAFIMYTDINIMEQNSIPLTSMPSLCSGAGGMKIHQACYQNERSL